MEMALSCFTFYISLLQREKVAGVSLTDEVCYRRSSVYDLKKKLSF